MKYQYIPTNNIVSVGIDIKNQEIQNIKQTLHSSYNSNYNTSPHITLLIAPINEDNYKNLIKEIIFFLESISSFYIKIKEVKRENNFFYLLVSKNKLYKLHKELIKLSKKYTKNYIREKDFNRIKKQYFTEQEIVNIKKYNYSKVLDSYIPHITLGNINSTKDVNYKDINNYINTKLTNIINKTIKIDKIKILYHTDNIDQSKMKILYEKQVELSNKT